MLALYYIFAYHLPPLIIYKWIEWVAWWFPVLQRGRGVPVHKERVRGGHISRPIGKWNIPELGQTVNYS